VFLNGTRIKRIKRINADFFMIQSVKIRSIRIIRVLFSRTNREAILLRSLERLTILFANSLGLRAFAAIKNTSIA